MGVFDPLVNAGIGAYRAEARGARAVADLATAPARAALRGAERVQHAVEVAVEIEAAALVGVLAVAAIGLGAFIVHEWKK